MKRCKKCSQKKPLEEFGKTYKYKDKQYYQSDCKECKSVYNKRWNLENKDIVSKWKEENKEYLQNYQTQYYSHNKEHKLQHVDIIKHSIPAGIYKITCSLNGRMYIGESSVPYQRKAQHFSKLTNVKYSNKSLQDDIQQYGKHNFTFEMITYQEDESLRKELEQLIIQELNPYYNSL